MINIFVFYFFLQILICNNGIKADKIIKKNADNYYIFIIYNIFLEIISYIYFIDT